MYKYDNGTIMNREPLMTSENTRSMKEEQTVLTEGQSLQKLALPALVLLGLAGLVGMSMLNNNLLLDQVLICSVIISLVIFVKVSGEIKASKNKNKN